MKGLALAPGTRADEAAGVVLARLLADAEAALPGVLEDRDPECLHDLRVAVRRARSVLRELKGVHPPAARAHLREELRWVQAVTGPLRDLDVQLEEWDELTGGIEAAGLRELVAGRRAGALATLAEALRSARFAAALDAWRALAATRLDASPPPIEAIAAARIRKVYRRMVRDGARIDASSPAEALHDLRKRGKELRYLLELFGGLFPPEVVKPMVRALKGLQDVLGRFQDRAVQAEALVELGREGGEDVGPLVEALLADQGRARDRFAERFAAFAAPAQRGVVKRTFAS